jgi:hypothetical protein
MQAFLNDLNRSAEKHSRDKFRDFRQTVEEMNDKARQGVHLKSRSATIVFFENNENDRKISKGLWGRGLKCRPVVRKNSVDRRISPMSQCYTASPYLVDFEVGGSFREPQGENPKR